MPFFDQNDLESKEIHPGIKVWIMWGEKIMMMLVDISPHAEVPTHTHPNEQAGRVLSGSFKLIVGGIISEFNALTDIAASIAPLAPNKWPVIDFVELIDTFSA